MNTLLKDWQGVQNYWDNIVLYGISKKHKDEHQQAVLQCLKDVRSTSTKVTLVSLVFHSWDRSFLSRACAPVQITRPPSLKLLHQKIWQLSVHSWANI